MSMPFFANLMEKGDVSGEKSPEKSNLLMAKTRVFAIFREKLTKACN